MLTVYFLHVSELYFVLLGWDRDWENSEDAVHLFIELWCILQLLVNITNNTSSNHWQFQTIMQVSKTHNN